VTNTAEAARLNYLSGDAEASLWDRCEENPPGACCEDCLAWDWKLVEAGRYEAAWKCRNCGSLYTQEGD